MEGGEGQEEPDRSSGLIELVDKQRLETPRAEDSGKLECGRR